MNRATRAAQDLARRRGNQGTSGLVAAIRAELERGDATVAQIAQATGFDAPVVAKMVYQLCSRLGGVCLVSAAGRGRGAVYGKFVARPPVERYMPVFRPLAYRADRDPAVRAALCELVRR